ncbi:MAG: sugar ABC transporter ATP-binding protein [Spartobacteria bacterium]|nr:sugar ABC transporter ATP-binding protein [Spartobacteria bacterium]
MSEVLLQTIHIAKAFSGVPVLSDINLDIYRGEILGIIGENGAGKSTLMKIISGIHRPSGGEIHLNGRRVNIDSTNKAKSLGITMIPQEFNLISTLTIFENIFLGQELKCGPLLRKRAMIRRTQELLEEVKTSTSPTETISALSVAEKQMVEIAKALAFESKILIMDEPTTVLTDFEVELLFKLMNRLREQGVTILYISHKLKEVRQICDRVVVLRDGEFISIDRTEDISEHEMACRMVGRELSEIFPPKGACMEDIALDVKNLNVKNQLYDISFELHRGEILGFSGLVGAGRTELAETIMGLRRKNSGKIQVNGQSVDISNPGKAVDLKLAYVSEDRQGRGLIMNFDLPQNITLVSLDKYSKGLINKRKERETTGAYIDQFNIKAASQNIHVRYLSGGNQQKIYLAKWMDTHPDILILDEPTRGIDINAKREMYHFIHDLAAKGVACMLISSEIEEVIGLCRRVIVMREGRLVGTLHDDEITEENIMIHATGAHAKKTAACTA